MNNVFSNRKTLYVVLSIILVSIFTLTVVYATLSVTLNISGNAEVAAANWDIHLDNVKVDSGSVGSTIPTITSATTASFSVTLNNPGDYYQFTVDVVNDGTIDAMIDSITKTPELTSEQAKYINYIVEYENGEAINTKQLVNADSFVRLKVRVEYRKDVSTGDLPTTSETLNLTFTVNYVQNDDTGSNVTDNGVYDPYKIGNEKCYNSECFYIISSDEDSVTLLTKYNITVDDSPKQSINASSVKFASTTYWYDGSNLKSEYGTDYPVYVYDSNSFLYDYVENYKSFLESIGLFVQQARLITKNELEFLGCRENNCLSAPEWVYATPYWSGTARSYDHVWDVNSNGDYGAYPALSGNLIGLRPVIVIPKAEF